MRFPLVPVISHRTCRLIVLALGLALFAWPSTASAQTPRQELRRVKQQIAQELRSRPEMVQARQEWIELRLEYQALRRAVVAELSRDSVYLGERAKLWEAEDELASLADHYRNGVIPADKVQALSTSILEIRLSLGRMEQAVLKKHQGAMDAHKAYIDAARRLLELNREMKDLLRSDPRFQEALAQFMASRGGGNRVTP